MSLLWTSSEDIALILLDMFPDTDPLTVRFLDMRNAILSIPDFIDDPAKSNEAVLEAIQMVWYDEWLNK